MNRSSGPLVSSVPTTSTAGGPLATADGTDERRRPASSMRDKPLERVRDAASMHAPVATVPIRVHVHAAVTASVAFVDPIRMMQVLSNALTNSAKHTSLGEITLCAWVDDESAPSTLGSHRAEGHAAGSAETTWRGLGAALWTLDHVLYWRSDTETKR